MLQYFLKCRKKQNLDTPGLQRQIKKEIFLSKQAVCDVEQIRIYRKTISWWFIHPNLSGRIKLHLPLLV